MLAVLPVLAYVLSSAAIALRTGDGRRASLLHGAVGVGVWLAFSTELLSLFHALTRLGVAIAWAVPVLALSAFLWSRRHELRALARPWPRLPRAEWLLLAGVGVVWLLTLIVALLAAPNNWDSMTYHMARVMHWMQNRSVAHYPTHIIRQLYQPPLAEWGITHLYLLSGSDRLAALVQWASMALSGVGASLLARELGAGRRGQIIAAVAAATLPMGILQATSTQNDYVVSLWLTCAAFYTLTTARDGLTWKRVLGFGASLGLAILTKGTAYFFGLPLAIWFAALLVRAAARRRDLRQSAAYAATIVLLVVGLNAGHLARNIRVFGTPFVEGDLYSNKVYGISPLISNTVRNLMAHVYAPVEPVDAWLMDAVTALHRPLTVTVHDPRTTFQGNTFGVRPIYSPRYGFTPRFFHEDTAGNTLHLALGAVVLLLLLVTRRRFRKRRLLLTFAGALLAGGLVFVVMLNYQPWVSRLHLPLFVAFSAVIGAVLADVQPRWLGTAAGAVLLASALPFLFMNYTRPLLPESIRAFEHGRSVYDPRADQYFANQPFLQPQYEAAVASIRESGCRHLGLVSIESWEYPLWALLPGGSGAWRIDHVLVTNPSGDASVLPQTSLDDVCLLVLMDRELEDIGGQLGGINAQQALDEEQIDVYRVSPSSDAN